MKRLNTTNLILGIIAAEVVCLTVQAIADRPYPSARQKSAQDQKPDPKPGPTYFPIWNVMDQLAGWFRNLFFGPPSPRPPLRRAAGQRSRLRQRPTDSAWDRNHDHDRDHDDHSQNQGRDQDHYQDFSGENNPALKGSMQGLTEKLKDPAWAGMLAANAGNVALTDAARAVPMPNAGKFVERLDRNPYVGNGMKNRSRDPR